VRLRAQLDVVGNRVEPVLHSGKQLHGLALLDEIGAVDAHALGLRLLVEEMHVGDERVRPFGAREPVRLLPEGCRVLADLRQEGVVLHGARGERAVEVVDQRDGLLVEGRL
jgi:hypothetical protein